MSGSDPIAEFLELLEKAKRSEAGSVMPGRTVRRIFSYSVYRSTAHGT